MSEVDDNIGAIQSGFDEIETHFRLAIEQSPLPIEILSPQGKIEKINSAWRHLWDLSEEEATQIIKNYNILKDEQVIEIGIMPLVEKVFSGEYAILPEIEYSGDRITKEMGLRHISSQSVWVQCHLYPIKDSRGEVISVINIYVDITSKKMIEEDQKAILKRLENETIYLQDEINLDHNFENIIGRSNELKYVQNRIKQVAKTDTPVLIQGETGTGKELVARAIHKLSLRSKRPLIKINCAALSKDLIESELFGHEKGSFTGAMVARKGRFEVADGSTLFLDEIGELPLKLQAKLLRVIESGEYEKLGSSETISSDVRIIAATNRILEEQIDKGKFREDLWYRLKVFPITLPPLRDRVEDIWLLVKYFVHEESKKLGKNKYKTPTSAIKKLEEYSWPGNIRELKNIVEVAMITSEDVLRFDLPKNDRNNSKRFRTLKEMERNYILEVLKVKNWKIGGTNSAASVLGLHVNTLRGKMHKLNIKFPTKK